jgi:hypothetical protein
LAEERRLTDVELERVLAGDYPPERARALEARMTEADRARLTALRVERGEFLRDVDVDAEARLIRARLSAAPPKPRRWAWLFAPGVAFAAAAVVLAVIVTRDPGEDGEPDIAIKGEVALVLHLAPPGGPARRLDDGDHARPGDRLRFEVRAPEAGYVAVVGIDTRGSSVYYPFGGAAPVPYDPAAPLLPGAVELDETLGVERVTVLYSRAPFALDAALSALAAGAALPAGVASESVSFVKEPKML